jgi:hypothetical protein
MISKHKHLYWLLALAAAVSFDQMFWGNPGGINFFLFICLVLLSGLIPLWLDKISIPWQSYLLLIPILFFSSATFWRAEPFTTLSNGLVTLGGLALFATTLLNGAWMRSRLRDHFVNALKLTLHSFAGGVLFFLKVKGNPSPQDAMAKSEGEEMPSEEEHPQEKTAGESNRLHAWKKMLPFLRGTLLALPILAVLAGLLSAADPVFSKRLVSLFTWFKIENLDEYLFRLVYILAIAYLVLSAIFHALSESPRDPSEGSAPLFKPFLGSIEANIVMVGVNLLFLLFVIIQFTYLFGGNANISVEGYTYSEYARRGFFELLAVAILSLLLFYSLSMITKRETRSKRWFFSTLGLFLVAQLGIILTSAYTRLSLYEMVYGFTRLRTVTHLFILWIGVLLVGTALLEVFNRLERLALVLILMSFGYALTLNLVNVDRFIVEENINRSVQSYTESEVIKLDTGYLYSLSYDSIPPLVQRFNDPSLPEDLRDDIGGVLACRLEEINLSLNEPLTSYHYSRARAIRLLSNNLLALAEYEVVTELWNTFLVKDGEMVPCDGEGY